MEEQLRRIEVCVDLKPEEISQAWRMRSRLVHPDKCMHDEDPVLFELAKQAFVLFGEAGNVLQTPEKRDEYDKGAVKTLREQLQAYKVNSMRQAAAEAAAGNYASAEKNFL